MLRRPHAGIHRAEVKKVLREEGESALARLAEELPQVRPKLVQGKEVAGLLAAISNLRAPSRLIQSWAELADRTPGAAPLGLSLAAMGVAAAGYLPPLAGALLQEGIDLAVILNALRALRG